MVNKATITVRIPLCNDNIKVLLNYEAYETNNI